MNQELYLQNKVTSVHKITETAYFKCKILQNDQHIGFTASRPNGSETDSESMAVTWRKSHFLHKGSGPRLVNKNLPCRGMLQYATHAACVTQNAHVFVAYTYQVLTALFGSVMLVICMPSSCMSLYDVVADHVDSSVGAGDSRSYKPDAIAEPCHDAWLVDGKPQFNLMKEVHSWFFWTKL